MSASTPNWSIWAPFQALMSFVLTLILSNHVKRLFYFASLYANLLPLESLKQDAMARLNNAMDLASSDDALNMPIVLSRMVWSSDDVAKILEHAENRDQLEVRAYEIITIVPRWMRFASFDVMKEETVKFLQFSDRATTPTVAG